MFRRILLLCTLTLTAYAGWSAPATGWQVVVDPTDSFRFLLIDPRGAFVARLGTIGWGPQWAWTEISAKDAPVAGGLETTTQVVFGNQKVGLSLSARPSEDRKSLVLRYRINAPGAVPILGLGVGLSPTGTAGLPTVLRKASGGTAPLKLPTGPSDLGAASGFSFEASEPVQGDLSSGWTATTDGDLRLFFARDRLEPGVKEFTLTLRFSSPVRLMGGPGDLDELAPLVAGPDWFPYRPTTTGSPSAVSLAGFLDAPAGKHGGVRQVGDRFVFEDGAAARFWGTNLAYSASAPSKEEAVETADRLLGQGVNAVRMHKFTNTGWEGIGDPQTAVKMDPKGLDRLDYFAQQLANRGIYYGWSHSFGLKVRPGDRSRLAGYDELMRAGGNTYAVINWAEDVQDLMIEMVVNLLKHKNPYTGKTYAQDPALAFIELQNEDDIFFYTSIGAYDQFPTYRDLLEKRFARWLKDKYGGQNELAAAWGGLKSGEGIAAGRVPLEINPWFLSSDNLPRQSGGARKRLLDNAAFLHEVQNSYYRKFAAAIRAAGYQGPLAGSSWQAPGQLPRYLNLKSDALVGFIDRHNYFGGGLNDTLLGTPGGGYLSSGLDQVADRPFVLSEWTTTYPSLRTAEGPVLVAAYGLGLQGWDASYIFQSTSDRPGDSVGSLPWGIWNADVPSLIGQFPILARMVLRGDITEAAPTSVRRIAEDDLLSGQFAFEDSVVQSGDVKAYGGSTSPAQLAQGRALVEFTQGVKVGSPGTNPPGPVIRSSTGQLTWDSARRLVTINTPATQGYVGFASGQTLALGDLTLLPQSEYASVLVTAADRTGTLAKSKSLLISAVARNANRGFRVLQADDKSVVANGEGILMEPVRLLLSFARAPSVVEVLDASGRPTGLTCPVTGGTVSLDTGRDRTLYYRVTF